MLMIKPRYLGPLVREELVFNFIKDKINESQNNFKKCMDNNDTKAASHELSKQDAFMEVLRFLTDTEWY